MSLLTSITPLYLSTLVEFITSMLYFLQSMYTLIIFVIMELVDVYGLFLVFFIFTNFVLFYYNFFFQVFLLTLSSASFILGFKSPTLILVAILSVGFVTSSVASLTPLICHLSANFCAATFADVPSVSIFLTNSSIQNFRINLILPSLGFEFSC